MAFRFRYFTIEDGHSTMRVGTDAMLLGAWAQPGDAGRILDIGSGCGVLALMMAQKSRALIDAVEIDPPSAAEAAINVRNSPWPDRIRVIPGSIQAYSATAAIRYDYIISNPPYYSGSLRSPSDRVNRARHDLGISLSELLDPVKKLLTDHGRFGLILPYPGADAFISRSVTPALSLHRRTDVLPKPRSRPIRSLLEFGSRGSIAPGLTRLTIRDEEGSFTPEYLALTGEFHNF